MVSILPFLLTFTFGWYPFCRNPSFILNVTSIITEVTRARARRWARSAAS